MKHVEAVIRMFDPAYDVRGISLRARAGRGRVALAVTPCYSQAVVRDPPPTMDRPGGPGGAI
jgi:hypothetical protein